MNHQCSQVGIAAFADAQQSIFATGAVLPRRQSQRGSKLSTIGKLTGVTDGRDEGGGDHRADAAQLLQALSARLIGRNPGYLAIQLLDPFIQHAQVAP